MATLTKRKTELQVYAPKTDLKEEPETVIYVSLYKEEKLLLHLSSSIFAKQGWTR